jgi:spermidine synthase
MTLRPSLRTPFLAALLGLSGACALIYQIAWLREFRLVFGGATPATAAVLAIFMGGLGAGSAWFGRRVERTGNPLRLYGLIEIGVGISALLTPVLLWMVRSLYIKTGGVVALGLVPATLLQLLLATVVLCAPCFLMGGSLPAAFQWAESAEGRHRGTLGVLYGINAIGAVTGILGTNFWLLEHWGIRATVLIAAIANILIGSAAWTVARASSTSASRGNIPVVTESALPTRAPQAFVYGAAALTGFVFFLLELVWFRMLAPLVASSVYGFGIILALALAGIGLGGLLFRFVLARGLGTASLGGLAIVSALQALFIALPWALGDRIAILAIELSHAGAPGLLGEIVDWTLTSSVLVLAPAIMAGIQFPLIVGLLGNDARDAGRSVGYAYAANTVGSIIGALTGGFVLLPLLMAPGSWRMTALLTVALSATALMVGSRRMTRRMQLGVAGLLAAAFGLTTVPRGPTAVWRHQPIGYGRVEPLPESANDRRNRLDGYRLIVPYEFEGREASVSVTSGNEGWSFHVNGKSDGSAFGDANTQIMLALVAAMVHPAPKRALVIGLGTGSTAGWLAEVPDMARVDVLELEAGMLNLARSYFAAVNRDVMAKPNVNVIVGDAREALVASGPEYDLIVSEPSNPYRAGIATLFTRDYYQAVQGRLAQGGLFAQWLQSYEVDSQTIQRVYATLASVFPYVETWMTSPNDLLFVCQQSPPGYSLELLRRRVSQTPFAEALRKAWFTESIEGVLAHYVASPLVAARLAQINGTPNTDDLNRLEYGFARGLAEQATFTTAQLLSTAVSLDADTPQHLTGRVDRSRIQLERLLMLATERVGASQLPGLRGDDIRRAEAIQAFVEKRYSDVLSSWVGQPSSAMEKLLLLESAAHAGTPEQIRPLLEKVAVDWPADARFAAAVAASRLNAPGTAVSHLREGFAALRSQTWAGAETVESALTMAAELASGHPERAEQFFELLKEPFPGGLAEITRLRTLAAIGPSLPANLQARVAAMFEPYPVWTDRFLEFRANAYRDARDLRAAKAAADLREFRLNAK